jgi:glycyl-tRNA synthetase beta chain
LRAAQPSLKADDKLQKFFVERLEFYLREVRGQAYDVVAAVLVTGADNVRDVVARAEAVTAVRDGADFAAVSAAFKRMKNILEQADARGDVRVAASEPGLIPPVAESNLLEASNEVRRRVDDFASTSQYVSALELIATLRPRVDAFFEQVMVLDPNPTIRGQRLYLLGLIVANIRKIADLSQIVTAG